MATAPLYDWVKFQKDCETAATSTGGGVTTDAGCLFLLDASSLAFPDVCFWYGRDPDVTEGKFTSNVAATMTAAFNVLRKPTVLPNTLADLLRDGAMGVQQVVRRKRPPGSTHKGKSKNIKPAAHQYTLTREDAIRNFLDKTLQQKLTGLFGVQCYRNVFVWGVLELALENVPTPFRCVPLLPYTITPFQWLTAQLQSLTYDTLATKFYFQSVGLGLADVNIHTDYSYSIAAEGPYVTLIERNRARPEKERLEAFVAALFWYVYAGGRVPKNYVEDRQILELCLNMGPLVDKINGTVHQFTTALTMLNSNRPSQAVMDMFTSAGAAASTLVLDETDTFHLPTVYTHPQTGRTIKMADSFRYTDIVAHVISGELVRDEKLRAAVLLDGGVFEKDVLQVFALDAHATLEEVLYLIGKSPESDNLPMPQIQEAYAYARNETMLSVATAKLVALNAEHQSYITGEHIVRCTDSFAYNKTSGLFVRMMREKDKEVDDSLTRLNKNTLVRKFAATTSGGVNVGDLFSSLSTEEYKILSLANPSIQPALEAGKFINTSIPDNLKTLLSCVFTRGAWAREMISGNFQDKLLGVLDTYSSNLATDITIDNFANATVPLYRVRRGDGSTTDTVIIWPKQKKLEAYITRSSGIVLDSALTSGLAQGAVTQVLSTSAREDFLVMRETFNKAVHLKKPGSIEEGLVWLKGNIVDAMAKGYNRTIVGLTTLVVFRKEEADKILNPALLAVTAEKPGKNATPTCVTLDFDHAAKIILDIEGVNFLYVVSGEALFASISWDVDAVRLMWEYAYDLALVRHTAFFLTVDENDMTVLTMAASNELPRGAPNIVETWPADAQVAEPSLAPEQLAAFEWATTGYFISPRNVRALVARHTEMAIVLARPDVFSIDYHQDRVSALRKDSNSHGGTIVNTTTLGKKYQAVRYEHTAFRTQFG